MKRALSLLSISILILSGINSRAQSPMGVVSGGQQPAGTAQFNLVLSDPFSAYYPSYDWGYGFDEYGNPLGSYVASISQTGNPPVYTSNSWSFPTGDGYGNLDLGLNMVQQSQTAAGAYNIVVENVLSSATWACNGCFTVNCVPTSSTIAIAECSSYTSPSGNHTWTSSGTYMDTITNTCGEDSVITINLSLGETPSITNFTSRGEDQWRVNWEYLLPTTVNDTNFRIRYWEQGFPAAFNDKSQFPHKREKKITGLDQNTWYETKVGFACTDGSFIWSATEAVRTKKTPCETPGNLGQALPVSSTSATVYWSHPEATEIKLRRRLSGSSDWQYSMGYDGLKAYSGLIPGSTYQYQVKALCSTNRWSSYSEIVQFVTSSEAGTESINRIAANDQLIWSGGNGNVQVNLPEGHDTYHVSLLDISGRIIRSEQLAAGICNLDVKSLRSGSYVVRINSLDGELTHSQVIMLK